MKEQWIREANVLDASKADFEESLEMHKDDKEKVHEIIELMYITLGENRQLTWDEAVELTAKYAHLFKLTDDISLKFAVRAADKSVLRAMNATPKLRKEWEQKVENMLPSIPPGEEKNALLNAYRLMDLWNPKHAKRQASRLSK